MSSERAGDETRAGAQERPDANDAPTPVAPALETSASPPSPDDPGSASVMRRTEQVEAPVQFNLASLLLTMTLICVCLGATASVPPVGIGLTILAVPAFVRTARRARRLRRRGVVMNVNECLSVFGASLGLVFASIVAGGLILYGTCTLTIVTAFPVVEALGAGTFATLLAAGLVILGLAAGLFGAGYVAWVIIKGAGEEADTEGEPPKS